LDVRVEKGRTLRFSRRERAFRLEESAVSGKPGAGTFTLSRELLTCLLLPRTVASNFDFPIEAVDGLLDSLEGFCRNP
jgi:hypothetical protein